VRSKRTRAQRTKRERQQWHVTTQELIASVEARLLPVIEQRRALEDENDALRQYIIEKEL
jgi:hypothetical protein